VETAERISQHTMLTKKNISTATAVQAIRVKLRINFLIIPEGKFCLSV